MLLQFRRIPGQRARLSSVVFNKLVNWTVSIWNDPSPYHGCSSFSVYSRCCGGGEKGRVGAGWCQSLSFVEWVRATDLPKLCNTELFSPPLQNCHGNSWIFVFRREWVFSVFFRCVVQFGLAAVWPSGERGSFSAVLFSGSPSAPSCHSHQFTRCFTPAACQSLWTELPMREFQRIPDSQGQDCQQHWTGGKSVKR